MSGTLGSADTVIQAVVAVLATIVALSAGHLRWLRVAQRVQYLPGEVLRIERLWFSRRPLGILWWGVGLVLALVGLIGPTLGYPAVAWAVVAAPLVAMWTPWRMPIFGVTKPLQPTGRLIRLGAVSGILVFLVAGVAIWLGGPAFGLAAIFLHATLVDLGVTILWPVERAFQRTFLRQAQEKLQRVNPQIVAITGSYGKTSTKGYVAHLVAAKYSVLASPASFNNLMGLSKSVNEKLTPGTEVFVAEMGMNQEGRIRELCQAFPPYIAAITVIGEAHLERLGSREAIFRAKSEITENASVVVLPVDQPELVGLAETCRGRGTIVVSVSAEGHPADVSIDPTAGTVRYGPEASAVPIELAGLTHPVNVAVALGIAWALNIPAEAALPQVASFPVAAHRTEVAETESGVAIIDDTYNSNPPGAKRAIEGAAALAAKRGGRFFVVTPGMVELGHVQFERNRELASQVVTAGGTLVAVGLTNRAALVAGGGPDTKVFLARQDAVRFAIGAAKGSDVILYENDLPDHYP
jgi:UDP-N-acetylmuramoyl-tripeptide--D-alanyl-D-alanine ligase